MPGLFETSIYSADGALKTALASITDHAHTGAGSGGQLTDAALSAAVTVPKGGTGLTSLTAESLLKGNGAGNVGLIAPGSSGQVLGSNGSAWAAITPPFATLVAMSVLGSSQASISLTSISGSYAHLWLILLLRSDRASNADDGLVITFNNDTGSNYAWGKTHVTTGGTAAGAHNNADTGIKPTTIIAAATAPTSYLSPVEILIPNYVSTAYFRQLLARAAYSFTTGQTLSNLSGVWKNSANAINRIDLAPLAGSNFVAGSMYALYGIN